MNKNKFLYEFLGNNGAWCLMSPGDRENQIMGNSSQFVLLSMRLHNIFLVLTLKKKTNTQISTHFIYFGEFKTNMTKSILRVRTYLGCVQ